MQCGNEFIAIDELTDTEMKAHCTKCKQKVVVQRNQYSQKEWDEIVDSAKKHKEGFYEVHSS